MAVKYHRIGCGGQCPVNGLDDSSIGFIPNKNKLIAVNSSVKVAKGLKKKYDTGIVYLSPYWSFDGYSNLCPSASPGCRATCLVTSGQLKNPAPKQSQLDKTNYWLTNPNEFLSQAHREIESLVRSHAKPGKNNFCIRLNGTSDIPFERKSYTYKGITYKSIMDAFPKVQFYDYTKIYDRLGKTPKNYHLTFSASEINTKQWKEALQRGFQVAMVFGSQPGKVSKSTGLYIKKPDPLPKTYEGFEVIDGDDTDLTFTRPNGVIIGLRMKGKAENDTTGFVKRDYKQANTKYPKLNPKTNIPNIISPRSSKPNKPYISVSGTKPLDNKKEFLVTNKSGRSAKPYLLTKSHIEKYFDLEEQDYDSELTLQEFLNDSYVGDVWNTNNLKIECIKIKDKIVNGNKEIGMARFKKGSKEAKAYMAKLRSMKDSVGATLYIEKGETKRTKPKRIVQVKRTKTGLFKGFSTVSGWKKGTTPFFEQGERTKKGGVLVTRRKKTSGSAKAGSFRKFSTISGLPNVGAVKNAIDDVKKHSDLINYYKEHIAKTKAFIKANGRQLDARTKAGLLSDNKEHLKTIAHHKKMLSQAKKMIK